MDKKKESFWSQYFRTLKRNKVIAAATFSAVVGSFGIAALRQPPPPPAYAAEGVLVDNAPVVSVSETSLKIHEQGKGIISKDLLLSDILLKATSEKLREKSIRFTSGQLLDNTSVSIETVEMPSNSISNKPDVGSPIGSRVTIQLLGDEADVTETTLQVMMDAMIALSEEVNQRRLKNISEELTKRVAEIESSIQVDIDRLQATENNVSKASIEQQIENKEAALDEAIALLADAELAEPEIVSSLEIASQPVVIANTSEEKVILSMAASGVSTAVIVVGGLIFLLNDGQKNYASQ